MQEIYELNIFQWIEKETIDYILNNSQIENYKAWEIIIIQGEPSNGKWYIIKSWEVKVEIWWQQVATLWFGDIFWEIALLSEEKRIATVKAFSDLELIILTQDHILEIINNGNESINRDIMDRLEQNLIHNR